MDWECLMYIHTTLEFLFTLALANETNSYVFVVSLHCRTQLMHVTLSKSLTTFDPYPIYTDDLSGYRR